MKKVNIAVVASDEATQYRLYQAGVIAFDKLTPANQERALAATAAAIAR